MSNREFTATRTMLANGFATAGAELLDYMGTSAALAAIPNTEPPKYVVAGTLAMIAKVLPSADAPAAATVLTDERIDEIARKEGDEDKYGFIFNKDGRFSVNSFARAIEAEVLAHAGVTADPVAQVQRIPDMLTVETIQGAIAFGRMGINPPPSPDHWGNEFWQIGRQLAKLGETSAWDNVTPVDVAAQVLAAEVRAVEQRLDEMQAIIRAGSKWNGNEQEFADKSESDVAMLDDLLSDAFRKVRSLAQQSTADKASEVRAAEEGGAA